MPPKTTLFQLPAKSRDAVCSGLGRVLANTVVLAAKTQRFHWHIEGELFASLHPLFGAQYEELTEATDEIAERIRALGHFPPASLKEFLELATIPEATKPHTALEMVQILNADHVLINESIEKARKIAADVQDEGTVDMLIGRLQVHDKAAWFLRSIAKA
jgi:starvation-inducible DNA-binding protein